MRPVPLGLDLDRARRILIIKPSSLGDVVHALPFLRALRRHLPDHHLAWLAEEETAGLLEGHPDLDEVLVSGRRRWARQPFWAGTAREVWRFARRLRAGRYDLVIDLQGLLKSAALTLLSGAPVRVGLSTGREGSRWALTHVVPATLEVHAVERYLAVAEALGVPPGPREFVLPAGQTEEAWVDEGLAGWGRPLVVLHAAARWSSKRWEPERFARVADALATGLGATILLTGGASDGPLARAIASRMRAVPVDLTGRTDLRHLVALLRRADLMVTVDSGPMHIAAALGTPLIALFGPTDPRQTGPYVPREGEGGRGGRPVVLQHPVPCGPCLRRTCPLPEERLCMRLLEADEVVEAAFALLERRVRA